MSVSIVRTGSKNDLKKSACCVKRKTYILHEAIVLILSTLFSTIAGNKDLNWTEVNGTLIDK